MEEKEKQLAKMIADYSIDVQPQEVVLIDYETTAPISLVKALIHEIIQKGGVPITNMTNPEVAAYLLQNSNDDRIKIVKKYKEFEVSMVDAYIHIRCSLNDYETKNVPKETIRKMGAALQKSKDERVNHRKWVLLNYPSVLREGDKVINTENNYLGIYGHVSDHIRKYSVFGAMPLDGFWGNTESVQKRYPMINFYQGDLDEFVSWADPDINTDEDFERVADWLWNSGNGLFYPGSVGEMAQSYVPSVGDMGVVLGGIFLPTAVTLANAITGAVEQPDTENPDQTTDDPVESPIEEDPYNTDKGTEAIDAWTGDIQYVCHGEELPLNYSCTHAVVMTGSDGFPYIGQKKTLHTILLNELKLLYTEGEGKSRVWCGTGTVEKTDTVYNPDTGEFEQRTEKFEVIKAVLSWNTDASKWYLTINQTEIEQYMEPVELKIHTDDEGNLIDYDVVERPTLCRGTMQLYADYPVSKEWTGMRFNTPDALEHDFVKGDVTTFMVEKEEKEG